MTYDIRITAHAERDISEAWTYIAHELLNPDAADRLLDTIDRTTRTLREMPERFQLVGDDVLRYWGVRMVKAGNYLLFYTIVDHDVYIIRFLYEKRNWIAILRDAGEPMPAFDAE